MDSDIHVPLSVYVGWNAIVCVSLVIGIAHNISITIMEVGLILCVDGTGISSFFVVTTRTMTITPLRISFHFVHCITAALPSPKLWRFCAGWGKLALRKDKMFKWPFTNLIIKNLFLILFTILLSFENS